MMTLVAQNTQATPIKILIVEDEPIVAENLARNLKQQGYEVAGFAKSGEDAILEATATHPDIVLMDIMLSGNIDGVEAAGQIRHKLGIPIIYMTAYADKTTLARAKQTEPYGYLVKPFKPQDMWTTIEIAIKRHQADKAMIARHAAQLHVIQEHLDQLMGCERFTYLPHRLLLQKEFERIVNSIPPLQDINGKTRNIPSLFAPVICLRLDRFQRLSNSLGYEKSDLLLKFVAHRLTAHLSNCGVLARLNADDEFAIVLKPVACKTEVSNAAQQLLEVFSQPFLIYEQEIFITASIGIAIYSRDGCQLEQLLTKSKKAMNYAQQQGGNRYEFYTPVINKSYSNDLALETDLRHALERQELQLYYQPKVNLVTGKIVGAEALLRWHHPDRGFVSPGQFIPLAEETGLIEPIGEWVLKTASQHIYTINKTGLGWIGVAVNLSTFQFRKWDLRQQLIQITLNAGIAPKSIELELTESMLIEDIPAAIQRLNALKGLGIKIAIDDFGTGYSSLNYLRHFPFDILKIDQCFVRNLDRNIKNQAITKALISMAHQLKLKVIAEGVENERELAILHEYQCDEIQGYLFSRPLPLEDFKQLVLSGKTLTKKYEG